MHRTKRAARNLAWTDSKNPFAKRWAYKGDDVQSRMENGDSTMLYRPKTDDPSSYPPDDPNSPVRDWNVDSQPKHAETSPAAVSRRRNNEPGDHIGEVPQSSSPAPSIKKSQSEKEKGTVDVNDNRSDSEKTKITENNSDVKAEDSKHGVQGWVHGLAHKKDKDAPKDDDNNNGKTKKGPKFTPVQQIKATLFNSWINVLLILSPVGIALHFAKVNDVAIFVVNFMAIIPLAALLSYATEEIALRTGEVLGGLLNASFGNAVELIVSIIALTQDQILIVQTSLIGSMLSNLLLVMGMCFFAGGINRMEQAFNITVAQTAASLLFLAVSSLIIPTAFLQWANDVQSDESNSATNSAKETELSRGTAILLLIVYACYLFFQLKSHADVYNASGEKNKTRDFSKQKNKVKNIVPSKIRRHSLQEHSEENSETQSHVEPGNENAAEGGDDREEPQLSIWVAIGTLAASTVLVALNAEFLVDSIDSITCTGGISKNFVGLILLPIVGNAAEHATAVTVAIKDKMDLAIGVAVGSSMQIALLVLPLVVVLGWIIGKDDMTLYFDGFQIAVLFVAVLLVNYLIQDGKSHWLEGVLLMVLYVIIAVAAWFYPTAKGLSDCPST